MGINAKTGQARHKNGNGNDFFCKSFHFLPSLFELVFVMSFSMQNINSGSDCGSADPDKHLFLMG
jgi:hypothetical protein